MHFHRCLAAVGIACLLFSVLRAEAVAAADLAQELKTPILEAGEASRQHTAFVTARIPKLRLPKTAGDWKNESAAIRARILDRVVFRGVPKNWYTGRPRVVWSETIETGKGYAIRKLRYEALPGLWIPALLYQPETLDEKTPVVLNVNGHDSKGKAAPYKQLRCINLAKRGILALNPEWLGMGQLRSEGYRHNHLAMLDLCGRSGLSVFYLAMSRGLDVLLNHPHADSSRAAVTGLSGGGWQTIILSSLDTRVTLSVPVAGYSALSQRVVHRSSIGDLEQNPTDLISIADYAHLTALMTPRPTLLIYNAKDNCCFVSETVRPNTYEPVRPFFQQAAAADVFEYYENADPGTHNYDRDNRQQLYRFLNKHFFPAESKTTDEEIVSDDELQTLEELTVALPEDNATFHSLAASAAVDLPVPQSGKDAAQLRKQLAGILRIDRLQETVKPAGTANVGGLTVKRFRIAAGSEWTMPAVVIEGDAVKSTTVVLADGGYASQSERINKLATAGERVICLDPVLIGQSSPAGGPYPNSVLISTVGERPLGVQTAQLLATVEAMRGLLSIKKIDVTTVGPRTGLIALCAGALDGGKRIGTITTHDCPQTLKAFLRPGADYARAPEVYCFGLLKWFDVADLRRLHADSE